MKLLNAVKLLLLVWAIALAVNEAGAATKNKIVDEETDFGGSLVVNPAPSAADVGIEVSAPASALANTNAANSDPKEPAKTDESAAAPVVPGDTAKLPEDKIPVLASVKETQKAEGSQWARVMITLGVLVAVLGAVSFALKRWMRKSNSPGQGTKIRVLTQHHLGPKKSLAIIQVAGESILIGITDHNISMLKSLALLEEEIPQSVPRDFNRAMSEYPDEIDDQDFDEETSRSTNQDVREDFALRDLAEIRDVVSTRLKRMRNI